ncbi:hypothetical protein RKE30_20455 [Streptomyces sp. Li-HN-5-11]|uniref:hypothetical protein n=1 Tax=Streptomyces sp. Li-HN-5-11 TaxID=3075432 RepID=UPI0028ABEAB9|nr:hypothetical protein [Streptomyces sp. Li-HN-5-11]WNM32617.1 hypothetical protein RKE30_20455 [Streptomyces sp. Li-HN-5-11]
MGHTRLFFGLLFGFMLLAAVIGLAWVPRLPKAPARNSTPRRRLIASCSLPLWRSSRLLRRPARDSFLRTWNP